MSPPRAIGVHAGLRIPSHGFWRTVSSESSTCPSTCRATPTTASTLSSQVQRAEAVAEARLLPVIPNPGVGGRLSCCPAGSIEASPTDVRARDGQSRPPPRAESAPAPAVRRTCIGVRPRLRSSGVPDRGPVRHPPALGRPGHTSHEEVSHEEVPRGLADPLCSTERWRGGWETRKTGRRPGGRCSTSEAVDSRSVGGAEDHLADARRARRAVQDVRM